VVHDKNETEAVIESAKLQKKEGKTNRKEAGGAAG